VRLTPLISGPRLPLLGVIAGGVGLVLLLGSAVAWSATLRIDPERTQLVVRTYKDGLGSALAHDHVVEATEISGTIEYDPARPEASLVVIEARTASLRVDDPAARRRFGVPGEPSESDRADIAKAMRAPDQLDVARYPTIRFASTRVVPQGEGRLQITGGLTIRGATREVTFPATVTLEGDVLRARATLRFLQSTFGYRPYSALLGAIRNKDEVSLDVDLVARP
jgi:polyisoprenoid-binding protein YceI